MAATRDLTKLSEKEFVSLFLNTASRVAFYKTEARAEDVMIVNDCVTELARLYKEDETVAVYDYYGPVIEALKKLDDVRRTIDVANAVKDLPLPPIVKKPRAPKPPTYNPFQP